jgi:hypothetical protein
MPSFENLSRGKWRLLIKKSLGQLCWGEHLFFLAANELKRTFVLFILSCNEKLEAN